MEIAQTLPLLPGDPRLIDHIICLLKSQGLFDQFRKECIADVDTKPAYQNLRQRVEGSVAGFLTHQKWKPDLNKNQLREKLRKHILDSKFLDQGVERIVDQVVNPKISSVFIPQVEEVVYKCFGLEKPNRPDTSYADEAYDSTSGLQLSTGDLLPNDLEAVSPDSEKSQDGASSSNAPVDTDTAPREEEDSALVRLVDDSMLKVETVPLKTDTPYDSESSNASKDEEFESPAFEPIEGSFKRGNSPNNSHLSGISDLTSHDSSDTSIDKDKMVVRPEKPDVQNTDSQLSQVSSDSNLSVGAQPCSDRKPGKETTFDNKFNTSTADTDNKAMKLDSSDASNTPCYKFSNDDNSSDARQSFDTSYKKMDVVNQESDVFEDSSTDGIFTKSSITNRSGDNIIKGVSGGKVIEMVSHHRSSIESKTSTESIKDAANVDMSIDSSESKSSDVSADNTKSGTFNFQIDSFQNRLTTHDRSVDADDSSSNDLKIDLQRTVSEEPDDSCSNGLKTDFIETCQNDVEMKEDNLQDVAIKIKSFDEHGHKIIKDKDEGNDRTKYRSKEDDRKSSAGHGQSKDYKDKKDDSKHHSKSSRHSSSGRRDSERKHSSSSSHDRKDSSRSKSTSKDSQSVEKDKLLKSNNGESSSKKDRHSSGNRSSTSHRHSSSSSRHHSSSSKHHSDDMSKPKHSHSSTSDKMEKSLPHGNEKTKHSSGHSSSQRDRKHSTSHTDEKRRNSNSTSDKKQDDKKGKSKSAKDDHYSSSGRGGKSRRSSDRDSNDGNGGSNERCHSHSTSSSVAHNNTSNKGNNKSSSSGTDNGSSGNSSGGQSNSLNETTINITKGSYIKSEFNMFQPIVKKPTMAELHMLNRSPEATAKKPVVHVDSQLNPVKVEQKLIEPIPPIIEVPPVRKPRFASNVFEARKLMKVRKQMEKIERRKRQEATKLLEEQQNVPKSDSQVFSGLSGPELEFACVKSCSNSTNTPVGENRTYQNFAINRKNSDENVINLLYFDNNPKSKAQIDYERAIRCLKKYLAVYSGVSEKKQTVLHLIECDNGLEQAFKRLSTRDHKIKTVNLRQNGAIIKSAPYKRVAKSKAKSQIESKSDLEIPDSLQFGKMISNFVYHHASSFINNKEPFVKLGNGSNKRISEIKTSLDIQNEKSRIIKVNTAQNEYCTDGDEVSDLKTSFNSSYDDYNDYYGEFDETVLQASKQDIMEIILGSGVNFDSTIVDLKRLHHLNSDVSSTSTLSDNTDKCNGKVSMLPIQSVDGIPGQGIKRNTSIRDADIELKINHNNNFKTDCTTPKKRKLSEKTIQESPTNHSTLCTMDRKKTVAPTKTKLSPKVKTAMTNGHSDNTTRRIALAKPKKSLTGLAKNKSLKLPLDIPCSPESDKSVENHINHNRSGKSFIGRLAVSVDRSDEIPPLNQSTQQMVKSIVRGCLGDNNVFKTKFVEHGQRKIATGFKRSHH